MRALPLAWRPLLALHLGLFFLLQALFLLLQPRGIVALPRNAAPPVQFKNPARHVVQEVAVVGHGDDRAGEGLEEAFQPRHRLRVQVVGGFVQQQDVRALQQQAAQGHATALAAGDDRHRRVAGGAAQGVHGHFEAGVQVPGALGVHLLLHLALALDEGVHLVRLHGLGEFGVDLLEFLHEIDHVLHAFFHHLAHGAGFVHQRFLLQVADGEARREHGLAVEVGVHPGQDLQQRRLARAVQAQHADLGAVEVGKGNVLQHLALAVALGDADHRIDDLVRFVAHCVHLSGLSSGRGCRLVGVAVRLQGPGRPAPLDAARAWRAARAGVRKRLRSPCSGICRRNAALVLLQTTGILSSARGRHSGAPPSAPRPPAAPETSVLCWSA